MTAMLLATSYPGGLFAVLSAIAWLLLTIAAPIPLLIGGLSLLGRFVGFTTATRSLKISIWMSISGLICLVLESLLVGWDAFFLLEDKAYFFEQFPANFIRAGITLFELGLSLAAQYAVKKKRLPAATA